MVAAESGPYAEEQSSFLDRLSPTQLRWAGAAAAAIGFVVAAATTPQDLWKTMDAHASMTVPGVEQTVAPPAQPWQIF